MLSQVHRMRHSHNNLCLFISLVGLTVCIAACDSDNSTGPGDKSTLDRGRLYTQWLYQHQISDLWDHVSDMAKMEMGNDMGNLAAYCDLLIGGLGEEVSLLNERVLQIQSTHFYERTANFTGLPMPGVLEWWLNDSLEILLLDGRVLEPEAHSNFLEYHTKTPLRLPFDGEWVVLWGGRTTLDNYHAPATDQRFAYDFLVMNSGWHYTGDGSRNEDHFCFGQPVVAPGAGVVVTAEKNVPDNTPPEENLAQPGGNYIVIDHENGEFSILGHFRQGSIVVNVGDRVASGQLLGYCGNSGASDLPHLHYHLQNTPTFLSGEGLPAQFQNYRANGRPVTRGEPTRGQLVKIR